MRIEHSTLKNGDRCIYIYAPAHGEFLEFVAILQAMIELLEPCYHDLARHNTEINDWAATIVRYQWITMDDVLKQKVKYPRGWWGVKYGKSNPLGNWCVRNEDLMEMIHRAAVSKEHLAEVEKEKNKKEQEAAAIQEQQRLQEQQRQTEERIRQLLAQQEKMRQEDLASAQQSAQRIAALHADTKRQLEQQATQLKLL